MKRSAKIGIGVAALFLGMVVLSSCTNSFCSTVDKAHILYAIDHGVSVYGTEDEMKALLPEDASESSYRVGQVEGTSVWYYATLDNCGNLKKIHDAAIKNNMSAPSLSYYIEMDNVVLEHAIAQEEKDTGTTIDRSALTAEDIGGANKDGLLRRHGWRKYYSENTSLKESKKLFENWSIYNNEVRTSGKFDDKIDECPNADFAKYYTTQMKNNISAYRSCLAVRPGYYGKYGAEQFEVEIQDKSWGYAWKNVGFLSGLLVYPIGWLLDAITVGMKGAGQGWAQLLAILFVTLIVRTIMLLATFKQTTSSSKMQELQPEIAKIQAKYPNSNTNQYEKQRMAQETQALYKKHKINPFTSILVMIFQFPIFICVWGAMQGSAQLSSGSVLGLNLSQSISSVLTTWSNWKNPASGVWTALGLFLLMAGAQTVAMLLPQWLAKAKKKKIAKLGRNPAQKESDSKTKWFTYIMLAMIIFMGFSLVSALGVYWLVGALFSVAQTLITHAIMNRKSKSKK